MNKKQQELEQKLVVGASIRIGKKYARFHDFKEGEIITLIEGYFDYDNGLYTETQTAPSIFEDEGEGKYQDYSSIYHLFGNNLEYFYDCQVIEPNLNDEKTK